MKTKKIDFLKNNNNFTYAKILTNFLWIFCGVFLIQFCFFNYLYSIREVVGASMLPTFNISGDSVIVKHHKKPEFLDVAIMNITINNQKESIIKRIIGLPGDTINIKRNDQKQKFDFYRNGKLLIEPYITIPTYDKFDTFVLPTYFTKLRIEQPQNFNTFGEYVVPENSVFVLGDNRANSLDSATLGAISLKNMEGIVITKVSKNESLFKYIVPYFAGFKLFS